MQTRFETPEWLRQKIQNYYQETTVSSYLKWGGDALALHVGLTDETRPSFEETLLLTNAYLADRAGITTGTKVLDAGCGVGGSSIWLALERGAQVTGITLDPTQVELAREFAQVRGVQQVSFEVMDYAATRFPEASFEVVWNIESLCHASDPRAYLQHVFQLLEDGGRWACLDFFRGDGGDPAQCEAMCEGWVLPNLQTAEAIAELCREVGFVEVEVVDLTDRVQESAEVMRNSGQREALIAKMTMAFGGKTNPVSDNHYRAAVGAGDGLISGSITYAYVGAKRPPRT